jgi:hypothetical protein
MIAVEILDPLRGPPMYDPLKQLSYAGIHKKISASGGLAKLCPVRSKFGAKNPFTTR